MNPKGIASFALAGFARVTGVAFAFAFGLLLVSFLAGLLFDSLLKLFTETFLLG
jgi:hypothetical protein